VTETSFTAQELQKVKCRGWFPRITQARPEGKLPKKPYQVCPRVIILLEVYFNNYANNTIYPVAVPQRMGSERVPGA
jgi:hypothetical protein